MITGSMSRPVRRRWWWTLWGLLAVLAVGIAGYAVPPYLSGNPANSAVPIDPEVAPHFSSLVVHALPGGLALIIGPFQFVAWLRIRYPKLHRITGRVYMISVVIASVASLFAATFSLDGLSAQVAFYLLAAAWLYSLTKAYRSIRHGEVQLHWIWMIRNYALTFTAVALRVYLLIGLSLKQAFTSLEFDDIYSTSVWAAIVINVVVAEYFIIQRILAPQARRQQRRENTPVVNPEPVGQGR